MVCFFFWRLKQDSILGAPRASVIRGSDSPPDCHSLPLLSLALRAHPCDTGLPAATRLPKHGFTASNLVKGKRKEHTDWCVLFFCVYRPN